MKHMRVPRVYRLGLMMLVGSLTMTGTFFAGITASSATTTDNATTTAVAISVSPTAVLASTQAMLAADADVVTVTAEAPAGTTQVWIDIEGASPESLAASVSRAQAEATSIALVETLSGASYRGAAEAGEVAVAVAADRAVFEVRPTLSLTFADDSGAILSEARKVLTASGAVDPDRGGSSEGGEAGKSGQPGKNAGALSRTGADAMPMIAIAAGVLLAGGAAALIYRSMQRRRATVAHTLTEKETNA